MYYNLFCKYQKPGLRETRSCAMNKMEKALPCRRTRLSRIQCHRFRPEQALVNVHALA